MNKWLKRTLIFLVTILVLISGGFYIYTMDYSRTESSIIQEMSDNNHLVTQGNITKFVPDEPSGIGLIFYPGGKVEYSAYYRILEEIRQAGISVYLVKMPFNLAVFNMNAAEDIIGKEAEIDHWFLGGHSLGGAMASAYASEHVDQIEGLILLGSYVYGEYPVNKSVTIYGENDLLAAENISYTENVHMITGGNHAQFGNYGIQKGDGQATISSDQQQAEAVHYIFDFIASTLQ